MNDEEPWFVRLCERIRSAVPTQTAVPDRCTALAFHEAGHAVVNHENGLNVTCVRIGEFGGRSEGRAHASASGAAVEALLDGGNPGAARLFIEGAVAGILAEVTVTATPLWKDAYGDLSHAKQLTDDACSTETEANALLDVCIEGANRILSERWPSVVAIANALHGRGEVGGVELGRLLSNLGTPR